jgi:hypothetical protein
MHRSAITAPARIRELLPADRFVTFLAQAAINKILVNGTWISLAEKFMHDGARCSRRATARCANCRSRAGSTEDRATSASRGSTNCGARSSANASVLQCLSGLSVGTDVFFRSLHAIVNISISSTRAYTL